MITLYHKDDRGYKSDFEFIENVGLKVGIVTREETKQWIWTHDDLHPDVKTRNKAILKLLKLKNCKNVFFTFV